MYLVIFALNIFHYVVIDHHVRRHHDNSSNISAVIYPETLHTSAGETWKYFRFSRHPVVSLCKSTFLSHNYDNDCIEVKILYFQHKYWQGSGCLHVKWCKYIDLISALSAKTI